VDTHWLSEVLPDWLEAAVTPGVVTALFVFSLVTLIATVLGVPWFFCRIAPEHFLDENRRSIITAPAGSRWRPVLIILKNVIGVALVLVGVLLLVLPGQGLLTIIVGLLLVNFPGKRQFEVWLVSREPVFRGINLMRRRAQREPLVRPRYTSRE
jgi:hypothetical protein